MSRSSRLAEARAKADNALREWSLARKALRREKRGLLEAEAKLKDTGVARGIAQEVAQQVQSMAYESIAGVVSRCLEAVFEEPYTLRMEFVQRRGRTEVDMCFERSGIRVDPLTASGGGVVDVASFALRLAALLLSRPPLRRLLVLDEPFKFVSAEYRPRVRALLEELSTELGVQIVMVTHIDELRTGKVVEL